jgi:hypothetical protein
MILPREWRENCRGFTVEFVPVAMHMRIRNAWIAIGESECSERAAEAFDWVVAMDQVVAIPDKGSAGVRRVNPEIEACVGGEECREPGNHGLYRAKPRLRTSTAAGNFFFTSSVQDVKGKNWSCKAFDEIEQGGHESPRGLPQQIDVPASSWNRLRRSVGTRAEPILLQIVRLAWK